MDQRWVPVSKRLPEYDGEYLVFLDNLEVTTASYLTGINGRQRWELEWIGQEVIAWMPLPEPYRPEN